jgi:hypothetical protein
MRYILKQVVGAVGLVGILAASNHVSATTLILNASEDAWMDSNQVTNNNGGDTQLNLGTNGNNRLAVMRFDVSSLATLSGATINSVTLNLTTPGIASSMNFSVSQLVAANFDWVEGTSSFGGGAPGASMSFKNNTGNVTWAGGALGGFPTYQPLAANIAYNVYTGTTGIIAANGTFNGVLSNTLISGWLGNANLASAGIVLYSSVNNASFAFYSSETGTTSRRPTITVDYTAVPEPTSMALVGVGLMGLMAFRLRHKSSASI